MTNLILETVNASLQAEAMSQALKEAMVNLLLKKLSLDLSVLGSYCSLFQFPIVGVEN